MPVVAGRKVGPLELGLALCGLLMLIDGFLPWFGADADSGSTHVHVHHNGWSGGYGASIALVLVVVVGLIAALRALRGVRMPPIAGGRVSWNFMLPLLSALGALLVALKWHSLPQLAYNQVNYPYQAKVGMVLGLIFALVQMLLGLVALRVTGEPLPGQGTSRKEREGEQDCGEDGDAGPDEGDRETAGEREG